ncbi:MULTISPECIES: cyclopropane-fatty-acyl-phospholipid synthase family protein [Moorena]|uniref:Cyclopropane fatty acid synthase/methyltransferase n=1 Tax=Moorena producens 3L TaxID=489825 RepID=F4XXR0_9CYAN|nr:MULTISPECIES: cyclopropane-fatty-acyl-phospholipid synthase family protein [Moorena]EGJ30621.1 cyclopropane fatty acid synthase/methyltransferase [Moorena producens 3L]NEP33066.1 class I SAM-dependent methyltransferase [Moorena sp. SIO3B2]NEP68252.1 class I SAM-dependent methyltransferase [Moorena sp. SIO3A5]NEQ08925.1 class I SAM-dependent methyltransferase [Moorena sp. SIO4E2]OLT64023.1 cyclopropane-fatty-acyl-phospholipid synthase [Moorena producens 3L]
MSNLVQGLTTRGGNAAAIQHHYDVSNEFYSLWLDSSLTYSCGFWDNPAMDDNLEQSQQKKIDWHLETSGATTGKRLLDIGCGWGALMRRYVNGYPDRQAVGLTLSHNQYEQICSLGLDNIKVYEESWIVHQPMTTYDAIVSIGAFEHFAKPETTSEEKISVYREFFGQCQQWLKPKGKLSLQTITYGSLSAEEKNWFTQNEIFPDSELPRPGEILIAADRLFEIKTYRNDRLQYGKTCDLWLNNLRRQKSLIIEGFGEKIYRKYEQYLKLVVAGFYFGQILLLRLEMQSLAK